MKEWRISSQNLHSLYCKHFTASIDLLTEKDTRGEGQVTKSDREI